MKKLVNGVEVEMSEAEKAELRAMQSEAVEVSEFDTKLRALRAKRDAMLSACDWTQMSDVKLSKAEADKYKIYRQALRDMTAGITEDTDFSKIEFPKL